MGLFGYAIASAAILGLLLVPLCMKNLHLKASSSCKCKGCTRHNCSVATDHTQSNRADANKTALSAVELPKAASGSTETEGERTEPPAVELPEAAPGSPETEDERAELSVTDPPACGLGVFKRGLTPEEYTEILRTHNQLRKKVALGCELKGKPGPQRKSAKLGDLKWSDEIAITAQNWANGCEYKHGGQRKLAKNASIKNARTVQKCENV
ncbi:uncharacterized protein [Venturia canescens]|uniref:uncharacterized protein isoform X2 n=1 Tax=Venturia canescens TaxID=32260 RepID=UPI001C9D5DCA|nr:uncharacterized protein LOC122417593 isoform X2 [Venturia canescens]